MCNSLIDTACVLYNHMLHIQRWGGGGADCDLPNKKDPDQNILLIFLS